MDAVLFDKKAPKTVFSAKNHDRFGPANILPLNPRETLLDQSFTPLVYRNHPFQPIGSLHSPDVFLVYRFVYQFHQSVRRL